MRISIPFTPNNLGRVEFDAFVMTGNGKSFNKVRFKLDSGSDFTILSCETLTLIGYAHTFLQSCPFHIASATTVSNKYEISLQYIQNVSIKFGDRELQNCRIFFSLETELRNLLGSDILKYFNWEINYDLGTLYLNECKNKPKLSEGESYIQIYSIESN